MMNVRRGRVITFYSYKGGVGRSMALANVAALLAKWKRRVLVLDWDLEAPGLEKFFEAETAQGRGRGLTELRAKTPGIVDIIDGLAHGRPIAWKDCVITADPLSQGGVLSIITAGRDDADYAARVRAIDWESLFSEHDFGDYLESLRKEWIAEYDFVLVDSRTGVTDVGGVCSIHLPDVVIAMFTANQQSVEGVKRVLMSLRSAHEQLPLDRFRLQLVPLPGRDESVTEHEKSHEWREIFATELADVYRGWLPSGYTPRQVLERLKIPYKPYWSFGERLPALLEGTSDPTSVGYAYAILAKLILGDLDWQSVAADEDPARGPIPATTARPAPSAAIAASADPMPPVPVAQADVIDAPRMPIASPQAVGRAAPRAKASISSGASRKLIWGGASLVVVALLWFMNTPFTSHSVTSSRAVMPASPPPSGESMVDASGGSNASVADRPQHPATSPNNTVLRGAPVSSATVVEPATSAASVRVPVQKGPAVKVPAGGGRKPPMVKPQPSPPPAPPVDLYLDRK